MSPRSLAACIRQANTIDITRRSPSYEVRLAKYALREFEILFPSLRRENIDPRSAVREVSLSRSGLLTVNYFISIRFSTPDVRAFHLGWLTSLYSRR